MSDFTGGYQPPGFPFQGSQIDFTQLILALQNGNNQLASIQQAIQKLLGLVGPTSYLVASLPASAGAGSYAWASNGRAPGQGPGAGTGVPVYWNPATSTWFSFLSGAVVAA
jgi:hypothetical protein